MVSGASRKSSNSLGNAEDDGDAHAPAGADGGPLERYNNDENASDNEENKQEEGFADEEPSSSQATKTKHHNVSFSRSTLGGK